MQEAGPQERCFPFSLISQAMHDPGGRVGQGRASIKGGDGKCPSFCFWEINPINTRCVALDKSLYLSGLGFRVRKMEQ